MWIDEYRNLDKIIKEFRVNTCGNEVLDSYISELLDMDKIYD